MVSFANAIKLLMLLPGKLTVQNLLRHCTNITQATLSSRQKSTETQVHQSGSTVLVERLLPRRVPRRRRSAGGQRVPQRVPPHPLPPCAFPPSPAPHRPAPRIHPALQPVASQPLRLSGPPRPARVLPASCSTGSRMVRNPPLHEPSTSILSLSLSPSPSPSPVPRTRPPHSSLPSAPTPRLPPRPLPGRRRRRAGRRRAGGARRGWTRACGVGCRAAAVAAAAATAAAGRSLTATWGCRARGRGRGGGRGG